MQGQFGTNEPSIRGTILSIGAHPGRRDHHDDTVCDAAHPAKVGETYFSHMAFAAWFCSRLSLAAGAALVHAFLPFLFETTASRIVRELYERTHNRGSHAVKEPQALMDRA